MNKARLCYILRSHYPKALGIRGKLQKIKVQRIKRHLIPVGEARLAETDLDYKKKIVSYYSKKWAKYLLPAKREMEEVLTKAPQYKDRCDLESIRTDILFCRLAYGFIPSEYVGFGLENRTSDERKTFASDVDMNVFGYTVNDISLIQSFLDKADSYLMVKEFFKRDAIVIEKKTSLRDYESFVTRHPVFVKKAVFSSMGKGVELIDMNSMSVTIKDYFDELRGKGKFLLEEVVTQSDDLSQVNSSSVNTVRCMTFNTFEGLMVPYCFFKTGRNGSFVDNAGLGGIVVGVNPETGECFTDGFTEYGERYLKHPDSGVEFKGLIMPDWDELISQCKYIASLFPEMRYLSFDMAHTKEGWVVIEVNEVGQFIIPQTVMQRGIKKELTQYLEIMGKAF